MLKIAAAVMTLAISGLVGGCEGDVGPGAGLTGISVTDRGTYVINAFVCRDKIDKISIVRDRQGLKETQENPNVQTYRFDRPLTGLITLDLAHPSVGWTPTSPTVFEPGKGYIVNGEGAPGYDNETSPLNIATDKLKALTPGSVYVSDDEDSTKLTAYSPADFAKNAKRACR